MCGLVLTIFTLFQNLDRGRQGGWPKIHRVTKCQQYDGLQQLEVETVETFWVRPYSPSSCPVHVEDGVAPKSARHRGRRCGLASVGWIGVQGAHLHRWRISNLGASPPCMAPWRQGAELLPRMNPCRRSWTSLNILLQPTKPFSWYSVSRGGVNLILRCYGRITDELFIRISLSALSVSSSQKFHIRLN